MAHFRQAVLSGIKTMLDGLASKPDVFEAEAQAMQKAPSVSYQIDIDTINDGDGSKSTNERILRRDLSILITAIAETTAERDQIALEIEQGMFSLSVGQFDFLFVETNLVTNADGNEVIYAAQLNYELSFYVSESDPETIES